MGYTFPETEPLSEGLSTVGLDSQNFLLNGGTVLLTLQAWIVLSMLVTLLQVITKWLLPPVHKFSRFVARLDNSLKWNFYFGFFFAGQIELFASIFIQLKVWSWEEASNGDKAAITLCILTICLIVVTSIFLVRILKVAST